MEDITSMRADTQEFIKKTEEKFKEKEEEIIGSYTTEEFSKLGKNKPEDIYLIDGLLERGLILFTGKSGIGKTRFVQYMSEVLSTSEFRVDRQPLFLGHRCFPTEIHYYSIETEAWELYRRRKSYGFYHRESMVYKKNCMGLKLSVILHDIEVICRKNKNFRRQLLFVIDPLMRMTFDLESEQTKSINNNDFMVEVMGKFQALTLKYNCSILILHHEGKNDKNDVLGATAIQAVCNQIFTLKEENKNNMEFLLKNVKSRKTLINDISIKSYPDSTYDLLQVETVIEIEDKGIRQDFNKLVKWLYREYNNEKKERRQDTNSISIVRTKTGIEWYQACKFNFISSHMVLRTMRSNKQWLHQERN